MQQLARSYDPPRGYHLCIYTINVIQLLLTGEWTRPKFQFSELSFKDHFCANYFNLGSLKAEAETRTWVRLLYLKYDPRIQESNNEEKEKRKEKKKIWGSIIKVFTVGNGDAKRSRQNIS